MLDDIRNSTLLTMVSAVVMAVAAIALQPDPYREADAARKAAASTPTVAIAPRPAKEADACDTARTAAFLAVQPPSRPQAPSRVAVR